MLKRLRGRFGISAPRVAVTPHMPLRMRVVLALGMLVVLLLLAAWMFDSGRRMAGAEAGELSALQLEHTALKEEAERLRGLLAARENDLQIEKAAQQSLAEQHHALLEENARLKEELAVLERLSKNRKK